MDKAARWNPGPSTIAKTGKRVGSPRKRWEDDISELGGTDDIEESKKETTYRTTTHGSGQPKTKKDGTKAKKHSQRTESRSLRNYEKPTQYEIGEAMKANGM